MARIVLKVCWHPSDRYTLTQSVDGSVPSDLRGRLFGNPDKADFDQAVRELVAKPEREGHDVEFVEIAAGGRWIL
jgi:hypothetical protein